MLLQSTKQKILDKKNWHPPRWLQQWDHLKTGS